MGKRELLLVAAFVIVGALVYQFTAPPPAPGERSFSLSQLIGNVRRQVRGNRAQADTTTTTDHPVAAARDRTPADARPHGRDDHGGGPYLD